jgi:hypothetical protein
VRRARFWFFAILVLGAVLALALYPRFLPKPRSQPLRFSHAAHVEEAECGACHLYATEYYRAGVPTLVECVDCHQGTQSKSPEAVKEEARFQKYVEANRENPWALLPPLPTNVFFSHRMHTTSSKIKCETCHGDIEKSTVLPAHPPLRFTMSWCLHCHQARKASTDCLACHR